MVARLVRDQEAVGSNPVSSTIQKGQDFSCPFCMVSATGKEPLFAKRVVRKFRRIAKSDERENTYSKSTQNVTVINLKKDKSKYE